jgi:hypothetical protein
MKYKKFKVDLFEWNVELIEIESPKDEKKVKRIMSKFDSEDFTGDVIENIRKRVLDGGCHFYNEGWRKSLILLFEMSSQEQRNNVLCHEKRHLEDRIIMSLGIKDEETSAYLAGYLGKMLL